MTATYTWDVYSTLDGFGSYNEDGDLGGYWGKQGPEFLDHRSRVLNQDQRLVLVANTLREFVKLIPGNVGDLDPVNARMKSMPTTVISTTLKDPLAWPDAESGDAVDRVDRLKQKSPVPLRSHGSLSMNRALMAAGLVDYLQVSVFQTGQEPVFGGAADFDLELVDTRTFDHRIQEVIYRPRLHA
jgi:hypothetical protein